MDLAKIPPTARQKKILMIHAAVFVVLNIILWLPWIFKKTSGFMYPWPIWLTSAWALSLIGHWAALYTRYEDAGMDKYRHDAIN
jgi:hypothetical protein